MLRTARFTPRGSFSDEQLAEENMTAFAWWSPDDIAAHEGPDVFAPRRLATHLADLLRDGPPGTPREIPSSG